MATTIVRIRPAPRPEPEQRRGLIERATARHAGFGPRHLIPVFLASDGEVCPARPQSIPIGLDIKPPSRGPSGLREFVDDWTAAWGENFRLELSTSFWSWDEALAAAGLPPGH